MHPLLAQALVMGPAASGLADSEGFTVWVTAEPGLSRIELLSPGGGPEAIAWRVGAVDDRPEGLPDAIPFVPRLTCVAVVEPTGLTVTWPDQEAGPGFAGSGFAGPRRGPGSSGAGGDPVDSALARLAAGGGGGLSAFLESAFREAARQSREAGWRVEVEETFDEPLAGRVARLRKGSGRRSLTFSSVLGVATLTLLEPAHPDDG